MNKREAMRIGYIPCPECDKNIFGNSTGTIYHIEVGLYNWDLTFLCDKCNGEKYIPKDYTLLDITPNNIGELSNI